MIVCAVGVDLLLSPYTAIATDTSVWLHTTSNGYFGLRVYDRPGFAYPPLAGNLLVVLGRALRYLHVSIGSLVSSDVRLRPLALTTFGSYSSLVASPAMSVLLKLLAVVPQVATGLLVVYAVRRCGGSESRSRLAGAAWLFNPIVLAEVGIHAGTLDLYAALFSVLAVVLVVDGRPGWAGVSIALGVLTKLTPLFLVPVLIAAIARSHRSSEGHALRAAMGRFIAGFAAGVAVLLTPEAFAGSLHDMATGAFLRAENGLPGVGGLSIYGLRYLRPFSGLTSWTFDHSGLVLPVTAVVNVGAAAAAGIWTFRSPRSVEYRAFAGCGLVYLAVLLVAPVTNPQYLVWCLPFVLIVGGAWNRSLVPAIVLSSAGFAYYFLIFGPLAPLAPLAEHSPILSVHTLVTATEHWFVSGPHLWGSDHAGVFLAPCALTAIAAMVHLTRQLLREPADIRRQEAPSSAPRLAGRVPPTAIVRGLAALAAALATTAALAELPASALRGDARAVAAARAAGAVQLSVHVSGVPDLESLRWVEVPISAPGPDRDISLFLDRNYPVAGSSRSIQLGFPYHLRAQAKLARYAGSITTIDAAELAAEMRDTANAPHRVIMVVSGAFPRDVLSTGTDLVSPWVRAGGLLVWGGDVIGYYSALPHHPLDSLDKSNPRDRGSDQLLGVASVRPAADGLALGTLPTPAAQGLGLMYDRTGTAVSTDFALTHGGAALGWDDGVFNSIASVAVGRGHYVVFGGGIDDEAVLAQDVMRIISTRIVDASEAVTYRRLLPRREGGRSNVRVRLPVPAATRFARISLVDTSPLGVDSWHWTARIGSQSVALCAEPPVSPRCAWDAG
jgi:hypothetical protein